MLGKKLTVKLKMSSASVNENVANANESVISQRDLISELRTLLNLNTGKDSRDLGNDVSGSSFSIPGKNDSTLKDQIPASHFGESNQSLFKFADSAGHFGESNQSLFKIADSAATLANINLNSLPDSASGSSTGNLNSISTQTVPAFNDVNLEVNSKECQSDISQVTGKAQETQTANEFPHCDKHKDTRVMPNVSSALIAQPSLCKSCSKSMLSYVLLMQNFLNNIAQDISKQIDPLDNCLECVKENLRLPNQLFERVPCSHREGISSGETVKSRENVHEEASNVIGQSDENVSTLTGSSQYSESSRQESIQSKTAVKGRKSSGKRRDSTRKSVSRDQHYPTDQMGFIYSSPVAPCDNKRPESRDQLVTSDHSSLSNDSMQGGSSPTELQNYVTRETNVQRQVDVAQQRIEHQQPVSEAVKIAQSHGFKSAGDDEQQQARAKENNVNSVAPASSESHTPTHFHFPPAVDHQHKTASPQTPEFYDVSLIPINEQYDTSRTLHSYKDGMDDILSALYEAERGIYEASKSPSGWLRWTEHQEKPGSLTVGQVTTEAFVTIAKNNAEALGCLVLGSSLLLCKTTRTLCVILTDGVNNAFMAPLTSVFHVVQHISSLDSLGTTKLALLDEPELGISFTKLTVWRLEQFKKCVYLNPDTMVVRNCDELFCHEELSAVPDIGWPDCFNSGVFVYTPSTETFWQLLHFAEEQGSFDGGDQGLLNTYFNSWSQDIHKKLSFIYNLMANVSYTYTPAFKQFGRNVKIVQFLGPFKPWHVKFYSGTGQIAQSSAVHPTYVQFVHVWLNIFRISILPLFSQEIQKYVSSQNIINAAELLVFFPSPKESEAEFLLTPPSVRLYPSDKQRRNSIKAIESLQLPQTSISSNAGDGAFRDQSFISTDGNVEESAAESLETASVPISGSAQTSADVTPSKTGNDSSLTITTPAANSEATKKGDTAADDDEVKTPPVKKTDIPGYEVGDYQGMMAWEQGRMDYEGGASSDTIIRRLHYLMGKPRLQEK